MEPLWFFLGFVPIANIVAAWKICQELAKKFGKSEGFGIGLFSPRTHLRSGMLAFGDAKYQSAAAPRSMTIMTMRTKTKTRMKTTDPGRRCETRKRTRTT